MSTLLPIALLTDFGTEDVYVGVMKGVIAQINSALVCLDLTHHIPPQNVALASFQLMNAYPHFPQGTVFVAVVDPGVGSRRRAIALQTPRGYLVGPDNGVFSHILKDQGAIAAVELSNPDYWYMPHPSTTFHGRDIFAPVAAHLASGVSLTDLGSSLARTDLHQLALPDCQVTGPEITGVIQAIDHFGNLITNIPGAHVTQPTWLIQIGDRTIPSGTTYSAVASGKPLGLIGSHGWVEIAVNGGHAQQDLAIKLGDPATLTFTSVAPAGPQPSPPAGKIEE